MRPQAAAHRHAHLLLSRDAEPGQSPRHHIVDHVCCDSHLCPSTAQIFLGLIIAVSSGFIYAYFKPFVEEEDDLVSSIAQYQIFFVLLAALMSLISSSEYVAEDAKAGDLYSDILFGWLLVIVSLIGPGIATAMLLRERLMTLRDKVRELLGLRQDTAANAAQEQRKRRSQQEAASSRPSASTLNRRQARKHSVELAMIYLMSQSALMM